MCLHAGSRPDDAQGKGETKCLFRTAPIDPYMDGSRGHYPSWHTGYDRIDVHCSEITDSPAYVSYQLCICAFDPQGPEVPISLFLEVKQHRAEFSQGSAGTFADCQMPGSLSV